jgi:hypothetical protein
MSIQTNTKNNFIAENKIRLLFFFLLFLLSSIGMFGQEKVVSAEVDNSPEIIFENKITSLESQIDFVSWFMGSKQSQMINSSPIKSLSKGVTKKEIIFLGITPNKVLYRTFMKKVNSQNNAIV